MQEIDWNEFRVKNKNPQRAFEDLTYFLFARSTKQSDGIFGYQNQAGIEKQPVFYEGKYIGFQSKFFENNQIDWPKIKKGIENAKSNNKKLNKIRYYLNIEFAESNLPGIQKTKPQTDAEDSAKRLKIELEWISPSQLKVLLNSPGNLDLAQLYFGIGDEFGFIKNAIVPEIQTLLLSGEYLPLPLERKGTRINNPSKSILSSKQKSFLLLGHPGCGKTTFVHSLFREFGGLDKTTESQMLSVLRRNNAVPMMVNLKNCINESLESVIRDRQNDSRVRGQTLEFIYLLDGLDELSDERADLILSEIKDLESKNSTKKIIISCRSGNLNRLKVAIYLPQINEFCFSNLELGFVQNYFEVKGHSQKTTLFNKLLKANPRLVAELKDILLVTLFWDTVESLNEKSTIADLMEKKIKLLLSDARYKKNIDSLNLLDLKAKELIRLNREISFEFQKRYQFRFSREELQQLLLQQLPRIDYRGINEVLNYIATIFFEDSEPGGGQSSGYVYIHRRYQEFFFAQKLKEEYEKDPMILRRLDILSGRDFFESFFLPYLRKEYEKEENVVGLLDINLLDVYLGNHKGYGIDDSYYLNSSNFIYALANQNDFLIEELLESGDFKLKQILFTDIANLRSKFNEWENNRDDYRLNEYLSSVWQNRISALLSTTVVFWESGKKSIAQDLLQNARDIQSLYSEFNFLSNVLENHRPHEDPYWKVWESYLFVLIKINRRSPLRVLNENVRPTAPQFTSTDLLSSFGEEGLTKLYASFFRVAIGNINSLLPEIQNLNDEEVLNLLRVLSATENLSVLRDNARLRRIVKSILETRTFNVSEQTTFVFFLRKHLGVEISEEDRSALDALLIIFRDTRNVDWHYKNIALRFAQTSFALGKYSFNSSELAPSENIRFYSEHALYTALFTGSVELIEGKTNIREIARGFITYFETHDERTYGGHLRADISFLWAEIFSISDLTEIQELKRLKRRLVTQDYNIVLYSFCYRLVQINKELFNKLITETDLTILDEKNPKAEDYQSLVDECLVLSTCYSEIDERKSREYFIRAMKESLLRHGWRKDSIVSYRLVEALKILWRNNWVSDEEFRKSAAEVLELTLRVGEFTDGAGTSDGPYNLIELAADYDVPLAEEFRERLRERKGSRNIWSKGHASIALGKVALGLPFSEIESELHWFEKQYDYERKPYADSYERKIQVYTAVALSDLYSNQEREDAFNKAYELVIEMQNDGVSYYLRDIEYADLKRDYISLCEKYNKTINIEPPQEDARPEPENESFVAKEIGRIKTKAQLRGFYRRLSNHRNRIVLREVATWEILIEKTYEILKNIQPLTKLLEDMSYPHTDWFTENSRYFYIPLGIAIRSIDTHAEAIHHLYKNTGHDGFINTMKAYEFIGDKAMCRKLFVRLLQLCHLLSESE